jgi:hypothetical protein
MRCSARRDTTDAFFDGDTAGCKWNGARGLSTSTTWVGKDGLHNLVEAVNRRLGSTGCQLVYRDHAASTFTYFDVVFARFEPDFNFRRSQFNYAQGVVRLQVRPFGHTGTTRIIATGQGSLPYLVVPIASGVIDGDWPAKGRGHRGWCLAERSARRAGLRSSDPPASLLPGVPWS